ncbi:MAG: hypothetical protein JKX70_00050 [Phycisphaerales bacterium]|nr:hypothetical protein [Phycisphaerales bacterium]
MRSRTNNRTKYNRRGTVLIVIVVVMSMLALVVAGAIRPVRDEANLATLRVETTRAFYASESGAIIVMNGVLGRATLPSDGDSITLNGQTILFVQAPNAQGIAIIEGISGEARRRIEFTTE